MNRLEYVAHPARRRPLRAFFALLVIGLVGVVALFAVGAVLALFAILALGFSIAAFLFPSRVRMDEQGVAVSRFGLTRRRGWTDIRRVKSGADAVLLTPFARPTVLDRTRGLVVFFGDHRDDVMSKIRENVIDLDDGSARAASDADTADGQADGKGRRRAPR